MPCLFIRFLLDFIYTKISRVYSYEVIELQEEGIEINLKGKNIELKGYLLKKGKPLKERLKEQMDQLADLFKG